jgi:hypothetical protein
VTVQEEIGRSATTNLLDERIEDTKVPVTYQAQIYAQGDQLVQQRFPISWDFSCWSGCLLIQGMRMRGKQLSALDHRGLIIIVEPILTWLEARNNRMAGCSCVPGRMLARRAIAATDVPTLRTPTEMKPPTFGLRQTFDTPIASRL